MLKKRFFLVCVIFFAFHSFVPYAGHSSNLSDTLQSIFSSNKWSHMNQWLDKKRRIYIRIPNLHSGFVTADQARTLFRKMEKRLQTESFSIQSEDGTEEKQWLVRARWTFYDRSLDETYTYSVEIGWEYRKGWKLVFFQAK